MSEPTDAPTKEVTVTCHTAGCENEDTPITLTVPDVPSPYVACGVCGQQITAVV